MANEAVRLVNWAPYPGVAAGARVKLWVPGGSAPDTAPPVVSNITPATGTPINPEDPIAFDVTDPSENLAGVKVLAYYPALGTFEVIYFDEAIAGTGFTGGFGPQYSGTRTPISTGFEFTDVVRRGGWPSTPHLIVVAGDTAGNPVE